MVEKIINLIIEYYSNNKSVDTYFIDKILEIIVNENGLNSYVKNVEYNLKRDQYTMVENASYQIKEKKITVNIYKLLEQLLTEYALINYQIDPICARYNYYFSAVQQILHEVEHASQLKKVMKANPFRYTDEEILINITIQAMDVYNEENYIQNYRINPLERMAQISSYSLVEKVVSKIDNERIKKYTKLRSLEEKMRGYEEQSGGIVGSTSIYLEKIKLNEIKNHLHCYKNPQDIYLSEKLYLGIEISSESYRSINNEIIQLNRELKRPI